MRILSGLGCLVMLGAGGAAWAGSMNNVDRSFMVTAAKMDMTEAHKGQMAETQAARADVKNFAGTLVQDHTDSYVRLTEIAAKNGTKIPRGIDAAKGPGIVELVHLKGDRFDRQFVREEIAADRRALALFRREAAHGHDADIKDYATKTVALIEKDLQIAQACARPARRS
jgi:putative membrane protein